MLSVTDGINIGIGYKLTEICLQLTPVPSDVVYDFYLHLSGK